MKIVEIKFTFGRSGYCDKCQQYWGETNLEYEGARIWKACKCDGLKEYQVVFLNTENLECKLTTISSGLTCTATPKTPLGTVEE